MPTDRTLQVKASDKFRDDFCKGLRAFADLPAVKRCILVYTGKDRLQTRDQIEVLPFPDFCEALHEDRL